MVSTVQKKKFIVSNEYDGKRLDKYLSECLSDISRTLIQRLIKDGLVLVNNTVSKAGHKLKKTDKVFVSIPDLKSPEVKAQEIKLDVVMEDNDLIVVNKSQGMVTHPASGHFEGTLVNALLAHCKGSLSGINGVMRPGIVHRLDKETSGLIIACKNDKSHNEIAKQLKDRKVKRSYLAIVHGNVQYDRGVINKPIGRHKTQRHKMAVVTGGRVAITHWEVIKRMGSYTLLELTLETGRTHQIRVHMASLGYPVLGDKTYGKKNDECDSMMLHAYKLDFTHPTTNKKIKLETNMPERFKDRIVICAQ